MTTVLQSPADRLAALVEGLCRAVAAHGVRGLLTAPLILLLWSRLRRIALRAQRLARRIAAGEPLSVPRAKAPRRATSPPYLRLPQGLAWLVRAVPATTSGASQLQFLLADPQMAELAQSPPMRRLLRPLCRMLGVALPTVDPPPPVATAAPPDGRIPPETGRSAPQRFGPQPSAPQQSAPHPPVRQACPASPAAPLSA